MDSFLGEIQDNWLKDLTGFKVDTDKLSCWCDLSDPTQSVDGYPTRENTYLLKIPTSVNSPYSSDIEVFLFLDLESDEIKSLSYSVIGIDSKGKVEKISAPLLEPDVAVVENKLFDIIQNQDHHNLENVILARLRKMPISELEMAKDFFTDVSYDKKQQAKYDKVICEKNIDFAGSKNGVKNGNEYKDGKRHGQGSRTYPNGSIYVGEWKDGQCHGQGKWTHPNGNEYFGEWKDNNMNGHGTYIWADGRKYIGEFKDSNMHGHGSYTSPYGDKYIGEWKDGLFHGKGELYNDGQKYIGELKDAKTHGQGTMIYPNGNKYVGGWKNGHMHGQGTFTWADGSKYVGEWKKSKEHGLGSYTGSDGKVKNGAWKNGEYVGKE